MSQKVVTPNPCRLSFPALFQPKKSKDGQSEPKYQATLLIPKNDTATVQQIVAALNTELAEASSPTGIWKGRAPAQPTMTLYDGDAPNPKSGEAWGEECHGCMVLRTSSGRPPECVDETGQKVLNATKFYAGCWCYFSLNFAAYDTNGNKGVGAFLNCVMFARDDETLEGHADASEDFAAIINANRTAAPTGYAAPVPGVPGVPAYPQAAMAYPQAAPTTPAYPQAATAPMAPTAQPPVAMPSYGGPNPWQQAAAPAPAYPQTAPGVPMYGISGQQ